MNIGVYQSASALGALERWQETVAQNITSNQTAGYRKRTVSFAAEAAGKLNPGARASGDEPAVFPRASSRISFANGEAQPTRRELDVALQGEGFFELQRADGTQVYTRSGAFQLRPDRTVIDTTGAEVLTEGGGPITLLPDAGPLVIARDGTLVQGTTTLGKLAVRKFADPSQIHAAGGGVFVAAPGAVPQTVETPELLQGYLEGSNVAPMREMVDLVLISRAYEANQRIITATDQRLQKVLEALG